ncbi:MAG TPA: hypothetical protein PLP16_06905 [Smithellaceae bacterium]|nr:hypothetical protein [Smithellaceae bacterium]
MNEMMNQYVTGEAAGIFEEIHIPVVTANGELGPINFEANIGIWGHWRRLS